MAQDTLLILLDQWESVYKKGLLTFWVLLLLHERPSYVFEMGEQLEELSQGSISVDDKSLYRALRRFEAMGVVESTWQPSDVGPRRRYYALTGLGTALLQEFTRRNILIFREPAIEERMEALLQDNDGTA
jgi:PadR family transcriptional regulator, regulatory protein PadR